MNKLSRFVRWHGPSPRRSGFVRTGGPILFTLVMLAAGQSKGADLVWTNTAGGVWVVPSNWSPNQVPGSTDNAFITNNGTFVVTLVSNATVVGLTIGGNSGVQTLSLGGPTLTINGLSTIASNAILAVSGSGTVAGSGDITVNGALNWTGGTMSGSGKTIIANGGTLTLGGGVAKRLSRIMQNDGTASWTAGNINFASGRFINNGSFTVNASANVIAANTSGTNTFDNFGTLNNTGTAFLIIDVPLNNSGQVNAIGRSIDFNGPGIHTGDFTVASGSALNLAGNQTFSPSSDISGGGSISQSIGTSVHNGTVNIGRSMFIYSGSLTFNGPVAADTFVQSGGTSVFNAAASFTNSTPGSLSAGTLSGSGTVTIGGQFDWTGGTMSGSGKTIIANDGALNLSTASDKNLNRVLQNDGTVNWTEGYLPMNGGTLNNNGSFTASIAGALLAYGQGGVNAFNNAGTFTKQGAGLTTFSVIITGVSFNNSGGVDVRGGTLTFNAGFAQTSGQTMLRGGSISSSSTMQIQGGSLGGVGTIDATVTSSGVVRPGVTQGQLTISGNYTQTTSGVLEIEVGGTAPGTNFDQLVVTGAATLDGILNIHLVNGFFPGLSNTFAVMTYGSRTGTFAALTGDGNRFEAQYNSTTLVLMSTSPPPACVEAPPGLVSWWRGENNALDSLGTNHGALTNDATFAPGRVGQAFSFDGLGDGVVVGNGDSMQLQDFTIEAWIRRTSASQTSLSAGGGIVFAYGQNGYGFGMFDNGQLYLSKIGINHVHSSILTVTDTNVHHVAVTKSGLAVTFFVDGVAVGAGPYNPGFSFGTAAAIGARGDNLAASFLGLIDEVALFNRALSSNEVAAIYAADSLGKCVDRPYFITRGLLDGVVGMPYLQAIQVGITPGPHTFALLGGTLPPGFGFSTNGVISGMPAVVGTNTFTIRATDSLGRSNDLVLTLRVPNCVESPAGLVAWWRGENNANDSIGAGHGTLVNGASFAPGLVGQAFSFDGIDGYIEITNSASVDFSETSPMSVALWAYRTGAAGNMHLLGKRDGCDSMSYQMAFDPTHLGFGSFNGGAGTDSGLPRNTWVHLAGTFDGVSVRLYTNGQLAGTSPVTLGPAVAAPLRIAASGTCGQTFAGLLDEISFFNRALSSNELASIYAADSAGFCRAPAITGPPAGATVAPGANYTFTAVADGSGPLTYQWRKNGVNLPGETNATFTINNAQVADVGRYSVRVSNANGAAISLPAELAVLDSYALDLPAGYSLIANQLYQSNNLISSVLPVVPNGTSLFKWDAAIQAFIVETYIGGLGWQPGSTTLSPGEGAFINLPSPQTLVFTGAYLPPTLPINLFAGYNLVSRQIPRPGTFEEITGRSPEGGTVVDRYRPVTDDYRTYVYLDEEWRDRPPVARVGEAVWVSQITRPIITAQPAPQTNATPGSTVNFTVAVSGTPPMRFQWLRNGVSIPDATNASYTINNAQIVDSGIYSVAVQPSRIAPPTAQPGRQEDLPGTLVSARAALRFITTDFPFSDDFGARPVVNSVAATLTGNNSAASRQPGEPLHAGKPGRRSVWLAWMAPANGIITFVTLGSSFDTLLAAYSGNGFPGAEVESDDDNGPFLSSRITFNATAGQIYNIAVDGFGRGSGDFVLSWNLEATTERVPVILTQPQNQVASLSGAAQFRVEAAGPNLTYQWFLDGQAVSGATLSNLVINPVRVDDVGVYVVRINSGSRFVLSHPVQLQIGAVQALPLAGNPKEGEEEPLAVDKFQDIVFAATNTALVALPGKAVRKVVAHGFSGTQIFSSIGSTKEADEPNHCGVRGGKSEWFSYQPTNNGALKVDTDGSNFDTVLAIYVGPGDDFLTLTNVACDNNSGTNGITSSVVFNVTSNTIYYIAMDGVNNPVTGVASSGRIHLNYRLVLPIVLASINYSPSNDNGRVIFKVDGTPDVAATVQSASSLASPTWTSLFTNTTASGFFSYTNTNALTFPNRFYRAINEF